MGANVEGIFKMWDKLTNYKEEKSMTNWNNYYFSIVSPELAVNSIEENTEARIDLLTRLHAQGISFKELEGVYKGSREASFLIKNQEIGRKSASFYGQESVLEVYRQKNGLQIAYLYYPKTGEEVYLGQFSTIVNGEGVDNYTYDRQTNLYFGIK